MELINFEIEEVGCKCENIIENSKLITCTKTLVRIELNHTFSRQLTICLRFPEEYPMYNILVELKSKTLSSKLLDGLTNLCEQKAKEYLGQPQIIEVLKFITNYLKENPLCVAYDEIATIKKFLNDNEGELKLRQKVSSVSFIARGGNYIFKAKILIPENYPLEYVTWNNYESNLPTSLVRFLNGQAREIARQCVEQPLRAQKNLPFQPKPSLQKTLGFIAEATRDFHKEICPICKQRCLPDNPSDIFTNDTHDNYIERVYCGHLYHQGCLKKYMREPPFPTVGKICPALKRHPRSDGVKPQSATNHRKKIDPEFTTCAIRLSHDRWGLNVKLAEARWAQQQARERELEEVVDFLQ